MIALCNEISKTLVYYSLTSMFLLVATLSNWVKRLAWKFITLCCT